MSDLRSEQFQAGIHFLQIPGPTNLPARVLQAMHRPLIDHRGPEFARLTRGLLQGLQKVFHCEGPVIVFPSSGSGAWEAALVNTLSAGDRVLMYETGHFATLWRDIASRLGLEVDFLAGDWRTGVDPEVIGARLAEDREHRIRAVAIVHNETSTGTTSPIPAIRRAMDQAHHPALLMVDTISSLGSIEYRQDAWGVDVGVGASQKGLMLPPGLGFNALSERAVEACKKARLARSYWDWEPMLRANAQGFFPYTPATGLLYGLEESLRMLAEEGLENVFARHRRLAQATRRAVQAWGLEIYCLRPEACSNSLTAVLMPQGHNADQLRDEILRRFDLSLGSGLGKVAGLLFRIGHLGHFNDLMLAATLCGVEMGLALRGVPHQPGGVQAALRYLSAPPA